MSAYQRNQDVLTGNEDLELVYSLPNFPAFMGTTSNPEEDDIFVDLNFQVSKSSGMVQLNPLPSLELVYCESHNPGIVGNSWKKHHKELSNFILKHNKHKILEIGGYSGILANNCFESNSELDWTIVDPHVEKVDNKVKIIKSFFDNNLEVNSKFDLIVHSHLLEHIIEINGFFQKCHSLLNENGLMIFSLPDFDKQLELKQTNIIQFEHTYLANSYFLNLFFKKHGFAIIEKVLFDDNSSVFYCLSKCNAEDIDLDSSKYEFYKHYINNYFKHLNNFVSKVNDQIENCEYVFLFGGHVTSQFLLWLGLNPEKIIGILDNDEGKQFKRLYGTKFVVLPPSTIARFKNPVVILKNSSYNKEIHDQLKRINADTIIIEDEL